VVHGLPTISGFNVSFLMAGVTLVIAVGAGLLIPNRTRLSAEQHVHETRVAARLEMSEP
jgi:hypothetical protein